MYGDQRVYREGLIEYGHYFQNIAKISGFFNVHPFDLAEFFDQLEKALTIEPQLSKYKIRCIAYEIFLYDTVDMHKPLQLQCTNHFLHKGRAEPQYAEIVSMSKMYDFESEVMVKAMDVSKRVSALYK